MRVIFLSDFWTILLCFLVWPFLQVAAALFCLNLPDRYYSDTFKEYIDVVSDLPPKFDQAKC